MPPGGAKVLQCLLEVHSEWVGGVVAGSDIVVGSETLAIRGRARPGFSSGPFGDVIRILLGTLASDN
jgi:hypothetical protein